MHDEMVPESEEDEAQEVYQHRRFSLVKSKKRNNPMMESDEHILNKGPSEPANA